MSQNGEIANPTTMQELEPKMKLRGRVVKIELFGAFVDIGVEREGLLHISQLSDQRVNNVRDVVSEGDDVTVWVKQVDRKNGRIDLTMIEPVAVGWNDLTEGQVHTGTVTRIERFGVFVDIGAERPGLVHVSELAMGYVNSPNDVVKVGDAVEVKVIGVNRKKRQIDLSMKALEAPDAAPEAEEEDEMPTAMAMALKRAMEGADADAKAQRRRAKARTANQELDSIIARTLQQHQKRD